MKPFLKIQYNNAVPFKKILLPALFIIFYTVTLAQSAGWMTGVWNSRSTGNVTSIIRINDVSGNSFTGTRTSETNDGSHAKITIAISGSFRARLYLQNGEVINKQPANAQWYDCSACAQVSKIVISRDSIILMTSILNCDSRCDGETFYYRLLNEYDEDTQQYLVNRFGRPSDILAFRPFQQQKVTTKASDEEPPKNDAAASAVVTNERLQHRNDSIRIAQQKKRQQEINDSLNLKQQQEQQRIKDSLDNVARLEKIRQRTEDSLRDVQAKKRQQELADSISLAQQKEQQRIKDSLENVARLRQQQINDSTLLAQQKKRDQEIADSLSLANQREQQRINDSLQNAAAEALQKQRLSDSLRDAQAAKRQREITDSLAALRKQQYNDSLQKAALAKAVPPINDSNQSANKVLTSRTSVLLGTYHITSPDILIELFDNGEIDGDIVSVYHNNAIIVSNKTLGTKPVTLDIHADAINREHEFVLVAENLGSIPPNSALMRVTAGKQIYKLTVNTDMKTNARIVFIYDGN